MKFAPDNNQLFLQWNKNPEEGFDFRESREKVHGTPALHRGRYRCSTHVKNLPEMQCLPHIRGRIADEGFWCRVRWMSGYIASMGELGDHVHTLLSPASTWHPNILCLTSNQKYEIFIFLCILIWLVIQQSIAMVALFHSIHP